MPRQRDLSASCARETRRSSSSMSTTTSQSSIAGRVPSALASTASLIVSEGTVSPVTSVTGDVIASQGGGDDDDNNERKDNMDVRGSIGADCVGDEVVRAATNGVSPATGTGTETEKAGTAARRRSSRARTSISGTYNVDVLADSQRKRKGFSYPAALGTGVVSEQKKRGRASSLGAPTPGYADSRNVSGETLVNDDDDGDGDEIKDLSTNEDVAVVEGAGFMGAEKGGLRLSKSLDSLDAEMLQKDARRGMELERYKEKDIHRERAKARTRVGRDVGDGKRKESGGGGKIVRRQSRRLQHAADTTREAVSTLGKRSREAMESGVGKVQALRRSGSTRLLDALRTRAGSLGTTVASAPRGKECAEGIRSAKKARLSFEEDAETSSVPITKENTRQRPRVKRWLDSGLYTGQERDFDPRLTETKNKLKRRSGGMSSRRNHVSHGDVVKSRKYMPLPMFAGERLLNRGRPFSLPYDIFSPLSERQPKPNEWRKTSRNLFVGDALTVWKKAPKLESSKCICTVQDGCDESCQNRFMFYECNDGNCNVGPEHCQNRAFAKLRERYRNGNKYDIGVEVLQTDGKGFGVRANRSFEPGQIIVEYAGEIITQEECERRMKTLYKKNDCYYLMTFHQGMIIDATRGSIARFVNHSCEPNCRMVKWTVEGEPRMALFAGEGGIMTGDELTYDYNFDPFSQKNVQKCLCGAELCRGVLGPKVSERPKPRLEAESQVAGAKRKSREISRDSDEEGDGDGGHCAPGTKKARLKTKSGKKGQKQKITAAVKRTASLMKHAVTSETKSLHKMATDRTTRVESAPIRSITGGRHASNTSSASSKQRKEQSSRAAKPGKLKSPFSKLVSEAKGISSTTSSSARTAVAGNLTRLDSKRRSLLQKTVTSKANGSGSSLTKLVDSSRRNSDNLAPKAFASPGAGKIGAGMKRVVGKGGLGRRRTVSGTRLR